MQTRGSNGWGVVDREDIPMPGDRESPAGAR
jgi:hypothetical protein